jgi:prefoldin subunit 5
VSAEQERADLKQQAQYLQESLDTVNKRISELENQQNE